MPIFERSGPSCPLQPQVLIVPGLNDSGPDHWQTHWLESLVQVVLPKFCQPALVAVLNQHPSGSARTGLGRSTLAPPNEPAHTGSG